MGNSASSTASPIADHILRLAGRDSIELLDPFWTQLLSSCILTCNDPIALSEGIIRSFLIENNESSSNIQTLTMHSISLLRDAKERKSARYQAANALHILRTLIVLSRGNPTPLFFVPLSSSPSLSSPSSQGTVSHKLFTVLIQQVIQVILTLPPGDSSYCLLLECVLFLSLSQSPTLFSPTAANPSGTHPFLDVLLNQGKDTAGPLIEKLIDFFTSQPRPHLSEQPWKKKATDADDDPSIPSPCSDDDDFLASAAGLFWMPFEGRDSSRPPRALFSSPLSSVVSLPLSLTHGSEAPRPSQLDLGDLSLGLLILLLRLPDDSPSTINYYREVISTLVDESAPPPPPITLAPIHDHASFSRASTNGGGRGSGGGGGSGGGSRGVRVSRREESFSSFLNTPPWSFSSSNKTLIPAHSAPAFAAFTPPAPSPPPPRACFKTLISTFISRGPSDESGTLLFYCLLSSNPSFKQQALSPEGQGQPLTLHLTRCLHQCPRSASSFSFILQALALIFSEDTSLALALSQHSLDARQIAFYSDTIEAPINLSSFVLLILLETIFSHFSLSTDPNEKIQTRGSLLPTNTLAAAANLAPHVSNLHPRAAQKLISSLQSLTRMRARVTTELQRQYDGGTAPALTQVNSLLANLSIISDYTQSILSSMVAITLEPSRNPFMVYNLLARQQDLLIPLLESDGGLNSQLVGGSNGLILEQVSTLLDLTQFFEKQVRGASNGGARGTVVREEGEALQLIVAASMHYHPIARGRGSVRKETRWLYVEDASAADFFLPYVWTLNLQALPVLWPTRTFPLFAKH